MGYSNKLVNPTPFDVSLDYEKGVTIKIPADSQADLTASQADDFREGKPGSEEVRKTLNFHGLFLMDPDLSHDHQAYKAITACIRERKERVNGFVSRLEVASRNDGGVVDETKIQTAKNQSGISRIEEEIKKLELRAGRLNKSGVAIGKVKEKIDPERTCLANMKEFPSVLALQMYLDENPALAETHKTAYNQMFPKAKKSGGVGEAAQGQE